MDLWPTRIVEPRFPLGETENSSRPSRDWAETGPFRPLNVKLNLVEFSVYNREGSSLSRPLSEDTLHWRASNGISERLTLELWHIKLPKTFGHCEHSDATVSTMKPSNFQKTHSCNILTQMQHCVHYVNCTMCPPPKLVCVILHAMLWVWKQTLLQQLCKQQLQGAVTSHSISCNAVAYLTGISQSELLYAH